MMEVTTTAGEKMILLSAAEYQDLVEDAGDVALTERARGPSLPSVLAKAVLAGDLHPLTAWRKAGGFTIHALATRAGVRPASISDIENGKIDPRYSTVKALAAVLSLTPDDIMR